MELLLDIVVTVLLGVAIAYGWKLHYRIAALQKDKQSLKEVIHTFDRAVVRAEANIAELKRLSADTTKLIDPRLEKAQELSEDMAYMLDRGAQIAETLEALISESRQYESISKRKATASEPSQRNLFSTNKKTRTNNQPSVESLVKQVSDIDDAMSTKKKNSVRNENQNKNQQMSQDNKKRAEALIKALQLTQKQKELA